MTRLLLAAAAAVVMAACAAPAPAASTHRCASVLIRQMPGGPVFTGAYKLHAHGVSCARARSVARAYLNQSEGADSSPRPQGFTCRYLPGSPAGMRCARPPAWITWRYRS